MRLNPYDPNLGILVPIVGKRIIEYVKEHQKEQDPILVTRSIMVPLWSQDPLTLVLAMVGTDGTVVGHAVAAISSDGTGHWALIAQTQADGAVGDAVKRSVEYVQGWVVNEINPVFTQRGIPPVNRLVMVTGKNEKAWERDLGFKLERRVIARSFGNGEEGPLESGSR